jgi:hypothetical protein
VAKQSAKQKQVTERVMHEWKHGELKNTAGEPVTDQKQAVAIALSEAGSSNEQTPAQNRRRLKQSERKEARGETAKQQAEGNPTKAALMAQARRKDIPGRSRMSKAELAKALKDA